MGSVEGAAQLGIHIASLVDEKAAIDTGHMQRSCFWDIAIIRQPLH
ncbi:hypothetical protein [Thermosporothrix hazakensis]|nr:hypothetical protein [Thermosporothrix hazakensis]